MNPVNPPDRQTNQPGTVGQSKPEGPAPVGPSTQSDSTQGLQPDAPSIQRDGQTFNPRWILDTEGPHRLTLDTPNLDAKLYARLVGGSLACYCYRSFIHSPAQTSPRFDEAFHRVCDELHFTPAQGHELMIESLMLLRKRMVPPDQQEFDRGFKMVSHHYLNPKPLPEPVPTIPVSSN